MGSKPSKVQVMIVNGCDRWCTVRLPIAGIIVAGWNLGVVGAWYAMAADLAVRSVLILYRFSRGKWKRIEV